MTPKQEAERIYLNIGAIVWGSDVIELTTKAPFNRLYIQKQCALIAVDEIIASHYKVLTGVNNSTLEYYTQVKQEIQKL